MWGNEHNDVSTKVGHTVHVGAQTDRQAHGWRYGYIGHIRTQPDLQGQVWTYGRIDHDRRRPYLVDRPVIHRRTS